MTETFNLSETLENVHNGTRKFFNKSLGTNYYHVIAHNRNAFRSLKNYSIKIN